MAQKRPFDIELFAGTSLKQPRLVESSDQIAPYLDGVSSVDASQKPYNLGEGDFGKNQLEGEGKTPNETHHLFQDDVEDDTATVLPGSLSLSPWVTTSASEDDDTAEVGLHLPFFPDYFTFDRPVRSFVRADDTYHLLMDYPPRKHVPIGPEHQADIPEWGKDSPHHDGNDLSGICVIPAPELEPPPYNGKEVGAGGNGCSCPDGGSVRCIREHVEEARDRLRETLGQATFMELGFCDMGEVVADRWTEEEEHLFHEVVYSNPASLGKNFWSALSAVFPSRTTMEIISYYFNVFMLRKRAEQNRVDPLNVDSDNDEWQGSDDDGDDEGAMTDEDEDSAVESPVHHVDPGHHKIELAEREEDILDEMCADDENLEFGYSKYDPISALQVPDKTLYDDTVNNDTQDGSCTSSDSGGPSQGAQRNPDSCEQWHHYVLEPCDSKVWDGYVNCPKNKVDLLPTCSMIKEVFGDAGLDLQGKRW
ncbi:hypothetical protein Ancab_038822 [Ancistrocladus abbreviatus]